MLVASHLLSSRVPLTVLQFSKLLESPYFTPPTKMRTSGEAPHIHLSRFTESTSDEPQQLVEARLCQPTIMTGVLRQEGKSWSLPRSSRNSRSKLDRLYMVPGWTTGKSPGQPEAKGTRSASPAGHSQILLRIQLLKLNTMPAGGAEARAILTTGPS